MPRGQITKDHFKILILQQKDKTKHENCDDYCRGLINKHLNELIDKLEEFRF